MPWVWPSIFLHRQVDRGSVDAKVTFACSSPEVGIFFLMHMLYSHRSSFKLCICILFNYMFQNFHVELIPRETGNGYQNMWIVIFERECVSVVCR
jgi:hypothetical protein